MFLSIGGDFSVRDRSIVGIFDLDNTSTSRRTREFLASCEKNGQVVPCDELPRSFIVTADLGFDRVYLSPLSAKTLKNRLLKK